jgi:plasmid replication initiation protein
MYTFQYLLHIILKAVIMAELVIYKANELAVSRYDLTEQESKLILCCVSMIDPTKEPTKENRTISFTYNEYAKIMGISDDLAYQSLKNATRELMKKTIEIKSPLVKGFTIFQWTNFARFTSERLELTFSEQILPYLFRLKTFIKYNLEHVKSFNNKHSMHVYEWLLKELSQRKTNKASIEISIKDFKYMLMLDKNYTDNRNLRSKLLNKIKDDINTHSNLKIDISTSGRPAVDLLFKCELDCQIDLVSEITKQNNNSTFKTPQNAPEDVKSKRCNEMYSKVENALIMASMSKITLSAFESKFLNDLKSKYELNGSFNWLTEKQKATLTKIINKYGV